MTLAQQLAKEAGVSDRATFVQGDMFEADISKATVLALFLLPENLKQLEPKFRALAPGTGDCQSWCTAMLYRVPPRDRRP